MLQPSCYYAPRSTCWHGSSLQQSRSSYGHLPWHLPLNAISVRYIWLQHTMLVIVTTNTLVPVADLTKEIFPSYSSCRKRWSNRLGQDENHFLVLVGSTSLLETCLPTICLFLFISAFPFWVGRLLQQQDGRLEKTSNTEAGSFVHVYLSYNSTVGQKQTWLCDGMNWL